MIAVRLDLSKSFSSKFIAFLSTGIKINFGNVNAFV